MTLRYHFQIQFMTEKPVPQRGIPIRTLLLLSTGLLVACAIGAFLAVTLRTYHREYLGRAFELASRGAEEAAFRIDARAPVEPVSRFRIGVDRDGDELPVLEGLSGNGKGDRVVIKVPLAEWPLETAWVLDFRVPAPGRLPSLARIGPTAEAVETELSGNPEFRNWIAEFLVPENGSRIQSGLKQFGNHLVAVARSRKFPLAVMTHVPVELAWKAERELAERILMMAGAVLALAGALGISLAGRVARPIEALAHAVDSIRAGNWGVSVPEAVANRGPKELGALSSAFNAMSREIKTARDGLERTVEERTRELREEKRRASEAQEALVRSTKLASLGELAGVAAHEILNPLNNASIRLESQAQGAPEFQEESKALSAIIGDWSKAFDAGGIEGLEKELSKPSPGGEPLVREDLRNLAAVAASLERRVAQSRENDEFLRREFARIRKVIHSMRALSRVGRDRSMHDLRQAVGDAVVATRDAAERANVRLEYKAPEGSPESYTVLIDREEWVQVLVNLIRNSIHAIGLAKRREGRIDLILGATPERFELRVSDNGTGIRPENVAKLFDTQFTTKAAEEGTGLGLSICRRIVRGMTGDVELEKTEQEVGTSFLVWIPRQPPR